MILLFEGHRYSTDKIKPYLDGLNLDGIKKGANWMSVSYVGYYYNTKLEHPDIVYILPKVFVYNSDNEYVSENDELDYGLNDSTREKEYLAFGEFDPVDLIDVSKKKDDEEFTKRFNRYKDFIQQLAIWVYLTVHRYYYRYPNSNACVSSLDRNVYSNAKKKKSSTLNDIILALRQFADENKNFFTFVLKQSHSGFNKVNWRRTVSKSLPFIQNGQPIYLDLNTKRKAVNYDEELLVILFSTLRYVRDEYDYKVFINENFNLMSKKVYQHFMKRGVKKMLELKYKYFSDKTIELWTLLFDFFKKSEELSSNSTKKDYLLVNSFHVVFEDMIDYLISDEPNQYPKELKNHADGKEVDHIYSDKSLTYEQLIYYVGDSKYYRVGSELEEKSIKKQYTYAKNIIQRNIDVICGFDTDKKLITNLYYPYRDSVTEGYNITPNFFISGVVKRDKETSFNFKDDMLEVSNDIFELNRHFDNRLFDRDTLILQRYNINFLFALALYARHKESARNKFRNLAREKFKKEILKKLNENYSFYQLMVPSANVESFVNDHFRLLLGRVFSFELNGNRTLLYAESQNCVNAIENKDEKMQIVSNLDEFYLQIFDSALEHKQIIAKAKKIKLGKEDYQVVEYDPKDITIDYPSFDELGITDAIAAEGEIEYNAKKDEDVLT